MADNVARTLVVETNHRFWERTGYKPRQKLKQNDATDRKMMPIWFDIYREVQLEYAASKLGPVAPPDAPEPTPAPTPVLPIVTPTPIQVPEPEERRSGVGTAFFVVGGLLAVGAITKWAISERKTYREVKAFGKRLEARNAR